MRTTSLALYLAFALMAGCGKKPDAPGGGSGTPAPGSGGSSTQSTFPPIDPATTGILAGVVKLDGWIKPDPSPPVNSIPYCASCHPDGPPPSDTLVLGSGQAMANVLVYVNSTFNGRPFPAPKEAAELDQVGCIYVPHVLAVRVNQPVNIKTSDSIMHNVHSYPELNAPFNFSQTVKGQVETKRFNVPELSITIKCDVHGWMKSYVHVLSHPFFALTKADGAFKIEGLPAGEYEVRAWHEKFDKAPLIQMVTVKAKETVTQNFEFKGGEKPPDKKK